MRSMLQQQLARLCQDDKGVTLVEYGVALVMMATLGTVGLIGVAAGADNQMDRACGTLNAGVTNCAGTPD